MGSEDRTMIIHRMPQGSEAWEQVRKGKATASNFGRIVTPAKLQYAAGAITYAAEVAAQRLGVESCSPPPNFWMERGTELEPIARKEFAETIHPVEVVGFVEPSEKAGFGCSPDGLIGDDAILEIKCPAPETLIVYHHFGGLPRDYVLQVQGQLFVTSRQRCHFYAWHPELEPFHIVVDRDENVCEKLGAALVKFLGTVEQLCKIKTRQAIHTIYETSEVAL